MRCAETVGREPIVLDDDLILKGENLEALARLPDDAFDVVYADPPFNTGSSQRLSSLRTTADGRGDRTGFGGRRYTSEVISDLAYSDATRSDYIAWIAPRIEHMRRVLAPHGTLYLHLDYREAHYCKVLLDRIFGRECFLNEIVWAYDYGGRSKRRWPAKHDTILVYVKDPEQYWFDAGEVDREPYMAPGLVTPEKAALGKLPTDCYSDDTEVLTSAGWRWFSEVTEDDRLATVTATGELVFDHPVKVHHQEEYSGPMIHFSGKMLDLLVTPGHSMLVRAKHAEEYEFVSAQELAGPATAYWSVKRRACWRGRRQDHFDVPPVPYARTASSKPLPRFDMLDWCEFMGWYLAEGSFGFSRDNANVFISQSKRPERVERIRRLLARMGLTAYYNGSSFAINNKQLATYLSQFGKAGDKHVPRELLDLDVPYLERLLEALMLGDGHVRPAEGRRKAQETFITTSPRLADDVQEMLAKLGSAGSITVTWPRPRAHEPKLTVSRLVSEESTIWPARHRQDVHAYNGGVHCATMVPNHTLLVRRGGLPVVCGNCWWHTIVPTNGSERTGYPTQKPEGIVRRMVLASSRVGGWCLDPFAGSGTLGAVARAAERRFVLIDENADAISVMKKRLA